MNCWTLSPDHSTCCFVFNACVQLEEIRCTGYVCIVVTETARKDLFWFMASTSITTPSWSQGIILPSWTGSYIEFTVAGAHHRGPLYHNGPGTRERSQNQMPSYTFKDPRLVNSMHQLSPTSWKFHSFQECRHPENSYSKYTSLGTDAEYGACLLVESSLLLLLLANVHAHSF